MRAGVRSSAIVYSSPPQSPVAFSPPLLNDCGTALHCGFAPTCLPFWAFEMCQPDVQGFTPVRDAVFDMVSGDLPWTHRPEHRRKHKALALQWIQMQLWCMCPAEVQQQMDLKTICTHRQPRTCLRGLLEESFLDATHVLYISPTTCPHVASFAVGCHYVQPFVTGDRLSGWCELMERSECMDRV